MENSSSSGISLGTLLLVLFVALKLCGVIAWSWVWVLSPLWLPFVLVLGIGVLALCIVALGLCLYLPFAAGAWAVARYRRGW